MSHSKDKSSGSIPDHVKFLLFPHLGCQVAEHVFSRLDGSIIAQQVVNLCTDGSGQLLLDVIKDQFYNNLGGRGRDTSLFDNEIYKLIHITLLFEYEVDSK